MATKSIIDIDVNDEKFKKFFELFEQYDSKVKDMPEHWKKLNEATSGGAAAIGAAVSILLEPLNRSADAALEISHNLSKASKAQEQFRKATHESENGLKKMGKQARDVAHTIFGLGKFVLKAGAVGTGLFAGGVFGLDRLAQSAVGNQRTALGMGLTTGQLRAFNTDLGRYIDPSILSSVARQQSDYAGRVWLARATGLSTSQVESMNAGAISAQLAIKAHNWWQSTPESARTTQNLQATGFLQAGLSLEDIKRLGNTPLAQLQQAQGQYARDASALNISRANTNALYDFARKLTLAGQKLETAFTNKLAALGPSLGNFITSLEKDAEILLGEILTPSNLKKLASGIDSLTNYLGKVDFQRIGKDIESFGSTVASIAGYIAKLFNLTPATTTAAGYDPNNQKNFLLDQSDYGKNPENFVAQSDPGSLFGGKPGPFAKHIYMGPAYGFFKANAKALAQYERDAGLPKHFLQAEIMAESGGNPNAVSKKGAKGLLQLMDATAKQYGVKNPFDPQQNIVGGTLFYRDMFREFKHSLPTDQLRQAIAAGNWGVGNVQKDVATYHQDWEKHIPAETENHIRKVLRNLDRLNNKSLNININNRTGASVAVSTNAAGI